MLFFSHSNPNKFRELLNSKSTGRLIGTTKPVYRTSYALVRYIASRPFTKTVSSSIDTKSDENIFKNILERIKEFFYS